MRVSDLVKMCVVRKDCFENEFADKKSLVILLFDLNSLWIVAICCAHQFYSEL